MTSGFHSTGAELLLRRARWPAQAWAASLALAVGLVAFASAGQAEPSPSPSLANWPGALQTTVVRAYRGFPGEIHLYVKDVASGVRYTHNAATPAYLASGVKILIMAELFRQIEAGLVSPQEELEYRPEDVRDGSPLLNYVPIGTRLKVRILLEAMIQQSDNTATDMVARRVGIENVNRGLAAMGIEGFGPVTTLFDVRRLVYRYLDPRIADLAPRTMRSIGFARGAKARVLRIAQVLGLPPGSFTVGDLDRAYQAYYATGANSASMEAMGQLLEGIVQGNVVTSSASRAMIELLKGTQTGARRITALLPPSTPVAHKTGTQYRRTCDIGIVFLPGELPVIFSMCIKGGALAQREAILARTARNTYDLLLFGKLSGEGSRPGKKKRRRKRL